jgi:hypothetical protein
MKKILFALCIACAINPAMAQSTEGADRGGAHAHMRMSPEERAKFMADKMQEKLSLSADQYAKILAVNTEAGKRRQALMGGDSRPDRSAFKAIDNYRQERFAAILTPAQMEQWNAMRAAQQQEMRGRRSDMQQPGDMPTSTDVPAATK